MKRIKLLIAFLNFINTYSISVALGSFSCYVFFSKIYKVQANYVVASGLALGVWFIYTLDHLLDGIQLKYKATARRHTVHFTKKTVLIPMLAIVGVLLLLLAFYVPQTHYNMVGVLMALTVAHFVVNYLVPVRFKRKFFFKEAFIAFVVSVGFCIAPLAEAPFDLWPHSVPVVSISLLLLNLTNLFIFSFFDKEADHQADVLSLAQLTTDMTIRRLSILCILLSLIFMSIGLWQEDVSVLVWFVFFAMQASLFIIVKNKGYFQLEDRYRFFGDLIYVYPLAALPFL
ncbi:hypothetical protein N9772_01495 [Bacteroidia bacterium]|jgi:hypothetical protein|nr:hypothetical protein [Bacteroidia bacterium]